MADLRVLLMIRGLCRRAAEPVMGRITAYLEQELGLPVNREKSGVAKMAEVTFLGFRTFRHKILISPESIAKFKDRVRELTHRNNPLSMHPAMQSSVSTHEAWRHTSESRSSSSYSGGSTRG